MTDYVLRISGNALEIVLQSLTGVQADYWKEKSEEDLRDYVFSRTKHEFKDVPEAAHIEGSWEDPDEIWHGFGPTDGCDCMLVEIDKNEEEVEIWKGDLYKLQGGEYAVSKQPMEVTLKGEYVLVMEADDRGGFDYRWNEVAKKPTPPDFSLTYSPGNDIVIDVTLFGKKADVYDDGSKNMGLEARIELASRFDLKNSG